MKAGRQDLNDQAASRRRHLFGFGAVAALALMLLAMMLNALHASHAHKEAGHWRVHTLNVMVAAGAMRSAIYELILHGAGYQIAGDSGPVAEYRRARAAIPDRVAELRALTSDNVKQQANIAVLQSRLDALLRRADRARAAAPQGLRGEAARQVGGGVQGREVETALAAIEPIEAVERHLLNEREAALVRAQRVSELAQAGLAAIALIFLGVVTWAGITASKARMKTLAMEERLRRAATTDELTGLLNRRAFFAALDVEIARAKRSGSKFALALVDLDHFKSINDRFGHAGGDEVLRKFAEVARETMRAADAIGRIGGEEFAVLMPDTDQVESGIAGERLRDAIARRRIVLASGALVPLTISVGVAHAVPGEDRDRLIVRADEALYDAKESGRNRTRLAA